MYVVFRNIVPPARRVCTHPTLVRGEDTLAGGGGVSIVRKTPDTALNSIYVSTFLRRLFEYKHCVNQQLEMPYCIFCGVLKCLFTLTILYF